MLISAPFLKFGSTEDNADSIQLAFTGQYPLTSHMEWHNGQHLVAPQENGGYLDVRAIADGKVIYTVTPDKEPSNSKSHAQNYAAFGAGPEWTDKGMVIIEHTTEIGANGNTPTQITFYSVYAHLKELGAGIAKDKKVYRKGTLGKPGQIYGQAGHIHFEICLDDANIQRLLGQAPKERSAAAAAPTHDGRIDAVFGRTYIYLPASTPVQTAAPTSHVHGTVAQTLPAAQWVQINYAGSAILTSYQVDGVEIGKRTDVDAEYDLYKEAIRRHNSLGAGDKAVSSPSAWYELLRFGRNLGRGSVATDKDPLPPNAAHWRKIVTPAGELWADLSATGTFTFSDADFPAFLGWSCFGDDQKVTDQRCDSPTLKALLTSEIAHAQDKARALTEPLYLFSQIRQPGIAAKLRKAICKFPTEFDQGNFEARYGHIKEEEYFKNDATGKNWELLSEHIKALTVTDFPDTYKEAQWHLHPLAFIDAMRRCSWLSKGEFVQCLPSHQVRTGKWKDTQGTKHDGVFWEEVRTNVDAAGSVVSLHRIQLNRTMRKFGISTPFRLASFLGNAMQESAWLGTLSEGNARDYWYAPWFGRGFLQLTHAQNYINYWRWRGFTISMELEAALNMATQQAHEVKKNNALQDFHFPELTQKIRDWRTAVTGPSGPADVEGLLAPSDSAGHYAATSGILKYSDEGHRLQRVLISVVDSHGVAQGLKTYYRSLAFWKVAAAVNLPGAVNRTNYQGINGFDSRCAGYGVALAVLAEVMFPDAQGELTLDYPEGYTRREERR